MEMLLLTDDESKKLDDRHKRGLSFDEIKIYKFYDCDDSDDDFLLKIDARQDEVIKFHEEFKHGINSGDLSYAYYPDDFVEFLTVKGIFCEYVVLDGGFDW